MKQLRSLATIGVQRPGTVAGKLDTFDELLSSAGLASTTADGASEVAKSLCEKVVAAIEIVKRKWPAETKIESAERDYAIKAIDATFGFGEFERYERITHRREAFLGGDPGSGSVDPRGFTRGIERKVLSRLADQFIARCERQPAMRFVHELFISPVKRQFDLGHWSGYTGLQVLERMDGFLKVTHTDVELYNVGHHDLGAVLLRLADLYLSDQRPAWAAFDVLANRVMRELASVDRAAQGALEDRPWFRFTERERELLDTAVEASSGTRNSFLEYLEARELGKGILEMWLSWAVCPCQPGQSTEGCHIQRIRLAIETVQTLFKTGRYRALVNWLDKTCDPAHPEMPPIFPIYIDEQAT